MDDDDVESKWDWKQSAVSNIIQILIADVKKIVKARLLIIMVIPVSYLLWLSVINQRIIISFFDRIAMDWFDGKDFMPDVDIM